MSDDDWDTTLDDYDYGALAYAYLTLVIVSIIAGVFTNKLRKSNQEQKASDHSDATIVSTDHDDNIKVITRASVAAIFLYLLYALLLSIVLTKWIVVDQRHGILLNFNLGLISIAPYMSNLMGVVPFILLQRLNRLLESRCIHIVSYVELGIGIVFIPLKMLMENTVDASNVMTVRSISAVFMIAFLLIYFAVAFLYLQQISKVMKARMHGNMSIRYMEMSSEMMNNTQETDNSDKKEENVPVVIVSFQTVQDTVRCALLVMICSLSNLVAPVMTTVGLRFARHETHHSTLGLYGMLTDTICNVMCIFLLFQFAEKYYSYWCKPCHECTLHCCMRKVIKGDKNKNPKLTHKDYVSLIVDDFARE